jgi:hypothetical protein
MQVVKVKEEVGIKGVAYTRQIATRDGRIVLWEEIQNEFAARGIEAPPEQTQQNLVVNAGRNQRARSLAGDSQAFINRVQLGDTKVGGVVQKTSFPPDLSDVALVNEIRTLAGLPGATFSLDSHTFPDTVVKTEPAGLPGTLTAGVVSTFEDPGADFIADGVNTRDQVTVFIGGEDFILGIKEVVSATELEVENKSGLSGSGLGYRVSTPGTQVLFTKLISGNNFPESTYGPLTTAHEAGLLLSDDTLFNRVTFVPTDNNVGLLLQPGTVNGTVISIQLDWLITY